MKMVVAQWAYYQGMIKVCTCTFTYLKNYYKTSSLKLAKALCELSQGPPILIAHPSLVHYQGISRTNRHPAPTNLLPNSSKKRLRSNVLFCLQCTIKERELHKGRFVDTDLQI